MKTGIILALCTPFNGLNFCFKKKKLTKSTFFVN